MFFKKLDQSYRVSENRKIAPRCRIAFGVSWPVLACSLLVRSCDQLDM
jgi:hypothetical protein